MLHIAFPLTLLAMFAGMKLIAQSKKESLGMFFKSFSWLIFSLSFVFLIGISVVGIRHCKMCCNTSCNKQPNCPAPCPQVPGGGGATVTICGGCGSQSLSGDSSNSMSGPKCAIIYIPGGVIKCGKCGKFGIEADTSNSSSGPVGTKAK